MAQPKYYGIVLQNGSSGPDSALVQSWLNGVLNTSPITVDGKFGSGTAQAVKDFQKQAGLTEDGKVGQNTWNALYTAYAAIHGAGEIYPGIAVRSGNRGAVVESMQSDLNVVGKVYTAIPSLTEDGKFGSGTGTALRIFQKLFNLSSDSVMGEVSFNKLAEATAAVGASAPLQVPAPYGGTALKNGSTGDEVRMVQSFLSVQGGCVPVPTIDGQFGPNTESSVKAFQKKAGLTQDGIVGNQTWNALRNAFNQSL